MGRESIGQCGCAQWPDVRWITAELELAICYIRQACGEPPAGCELDILWHEHELGQYASVGLTWDGPAEAPWDYISRAEDALQRFDRAVKWSELHPEENVEQDEESESLEVENEEATEDETPETFELYRRDEIIKATQKDWLTALALFQEGGWQEPRPIGTYARPLSFVKHKEGEAMQRAGQALLKKFSEEPVLSTAVPMDLGLFYRITEFVGGGAFIVGHEGAYENAKANDWPE